MNEYSEYEDLLDLTLMMEGEEALFEQFEAACLKGNPPPISEKSDERLNFVLTSWEATESPEFIRGMLAILMMNLKDYKTKPGVIKQCAQIIDRLVKANIDWRTGRRYE